MTALRLFRLGRFLNRVVVGLDPFGMKYPWLVDALVGMRPEKVTLRLQQIGRQARRAITIEVSERCGKRGNGHTKLDRSGNRDAPVVLGLGDDVGEIGIEQEIMQRRIALVSIDDVIQKRSANDAAAAPDRGDVAEVQVPVVLFARGPEQLHSLGVRDDLGGVERITHRINELFAIALELLRFWLWQNL